MKNKKNISVIILIFCFTLGFFESDLIFLKDNTIKNQFISPNSTVIYSDDMNGANDTNALKARGYQVFYRGTGPQGTSAIWFQGNPVKFPAFNGPTSGYVASDYNVVTGQNNIDCWLVLPLIPGGFLIDDSLNFYSRSEQGNPYVDSIRVMYSLTDSIPEGDWIEIGRFKTNNSGIWEKRGFKAASTSAIGRFAIRYCVINGGPGGQNSNYIGIDAISIVRGNHPVITHTKLTDCPKVFWPSRLSCQATDNYGIDSVWVTWNKNRGLTHRFNLMHDSVYKWSNNFNSVISQVNAGDSIFYRIIARNVPGYKDSTGEYGFCILGQPCCCIDTGTIACDFPFYTQWSNGRTDLIYTASEIISNGGSSGYITSINFNFNNATPLSLSGFNIKMKNTTDTIISVFSNDGWTICYSGTYIPTGTGWQYLNLTSPFFWNGTDNLLIEICFHDQSGFTNSRTKGTYKWNYWMMGMGNNILSTDGCNYIQSGNPFAYRPNICLSISPEMVGTGNKHDYIPANYSLFQNYPNPFNPSTKIRFEIPEKGFVSLIIYDILGKEITKLVNEEKQPGSFIIDFNGGNLPTGIYFYKLEVNTFKDVKRMVIIK